MSDDDLDAALCTLTALNETEIGGLAALTGMSDDEIAAFAEQVEAAWQANRQAIGDAKQAVADALREQARVEVKCGNTARQRSPVHPLLNEDEKDRVLTARQAVLEAKQTHDEAIGRFKAGVTAEQLAEV